jgi:hypothetical protein
VPTAVLKASRASGAEILRSTLASPQSGPHVRLQLASARTAQLSSQASLQQSLFSAQMIVAHALQ